MEVGAHQSPTDGPDGIYDFSAQTTNEVVQTLTSTHRLPSVILLLVAVGKADFATVSGTRHFYMTNTVVFDNRPPGFSDPVFFVTRRLLTPP